MCIKNAEHFKDFGFNKVRFAKASAFKLESEKTKQKIAVKCEKCGRFHIELTIKSSTEYKFKCRKCKHQNIGIVTKKEGSNVKI